MQERILTPEQVSQILQVHPFTVLKFIKQGKLKASKLGRVYRIRQSDLEGFLDQTSSRIPKAESTESSEPNIIKKIKNKNKTLKIADSSNPLESGLETTLETPTAEPIILKEIPVKEVQLEQPESPGNKPKHGGENHYYILQ